MERERKLREIFANIDEDQRELCDRLIDEVIFLERRMTALRELPFIRIHPDDPSRQKVTAAAKLYKECSQSYMNAIRILIGVLKNANSSDADELARMLSDFE